MISTTEAIEKAQPIRRLIESLASSSEGARLHLVDDWRGDRFALGIKGPREDALVYVSAWNHSEGAFAWSFEHPLGHAVEDGVAASMAELMAVLSDRLLPDGVLG